MLCRASPYHDHHYDISTRLRIETFFAIVLQISTQKRHFLQCAERVLLELVELLGQFAQLEANSETYAENGTKTDDVTLTMEDIPLDVLESKVYEDASETISKSQLCDAIAAIVFVQAYRKDNRYRLYEQLVELKLARAKLDEMLTCFSLDPFVEPEQKSIARIEMFQEMLNKSECTVQDAATSFIDNVIQSLKCKFTENHEHLSKSLNIIESDILGAHAHTVPLTERPTELHTIELELQGLRQLHIQMVYDYAKLESIHSSLGTGFDKQSYKSLINEQRYKLEFLQTTCKKSISSLSNIQQQIKDAKLAVSIADYTERLQRNSGGTSTSSAKSLKWHIVAHRLIQQQFHITENVNPVKVLFTNNDISSKGYLTKSEFKRAFLKAYPETEALSGIDEIDTIFEASYETIGKMRRGIEYPQFKAIIELGAHKLGEDVLLDPEYTEALELAFTDSVSVSTSDVDVETDVDADMEAKSISTTASSINAHEIDTLVTDFKSVTDLDLTDVNLTSGKFMTAFNDIATTMGHITKDDLARARVNKRLRDKLELVFPDGNYSEWFDNVDESTLYNDEEDDEEQTEEVDVDVTRDSKTAKAKAKAKAPHAGFADSETLHNVLYELERVDLSKI